MPPPKFRCSTLALALLSLSACGPLTFTVNGPVDQSLQRTTVQRSDRWTSNRIAIIEVSGLIYNANRPQLLGTGDNPVGLLDEQLTLARQDSRVKAVILRINSPGGTVTASDIMYRQIQAFRRDTAKPVVALLADVAASGGYYVACASDHIVAYPTSVTGSVGVLLQTLTLKPALHRIGIEAEAFTSGPNKDAGSPLSQLTDDQRTVLRALVKDFYTRFVNVVHDARPALTGQQFDQATDGRVMSGLQAAQWGLVDEAGDLETAVARAKQLAQIQHADLVVYHRPFTYVGSPYAAAPASAMSGALPGAGAGAGLPPGSTQINFAQINLPQTLTGLSVGFYYLWDPDIP